MLKGIPSLMASRLYFDGDALKFINAAGITNATQKALINSLVINAKNNGWWTLCCAIYPMVGASAASCKYNLKDPRDADAAFRLSFSANWAFASTGVTPDGVLDYADTFIIPSVNLTANSTHISFYSRTNSNTTGFDVGVLQVSGLNPRLLFNLRDAGNYTGDQYDTGLGNRITGAVSDSLGLFLDSRDTSTSHKAYKNGSQIGSTDTSTAGSIPATYSIYLGAANNQGSPSFRSSRECAFATIGASIDSTIAALMYTDIQNFQTGLGRNV